MSHLSHTSKEGDHDEYSGDRSYTQSFDRDAFCAGIHTICLTFLIALATHSHAVSEVQGGLPSHSTLLILKDCSIRTNGMKLRPFCPLRNRLTSGR